MRILSITMMCESCADRTKSDHNDVNVSEAFDIGEKQRCSHCKRMFTELYEVTKEELEALADCIDEIIEIKVYINELSSSTADIMLDSLFENEEALGVYKIHPEHQRVGDYIGSVMKNRVAFDFYVS